MRYRLQRHDGTDCSATMVPITVLRMVPIQRYRHLAVALSMQLGYSLGWMSAVLCVQCVLTLLLFVVFQIKKWKLQGERNR